MLATCLDLLITKLVNYCHGQFDDFDLLGMYGVVLHTLIYKAFEPRYTLPFKC
jgi:hypothetical protein